MSLSLVKRADQLALAYGLSAGMGIALIIFMGISIWCLRRRHKRLKAKGIARITQDELGIYCVCLLCSGCKSQRDGGREGLPCGNCKKHCDGN